MSTMPTTPAGRKMAMSPASASRPVKLFVGGLTRNTTTKLLREHFAQYGRILDCVAMCQPDGKPRGFGYVTLDSHIAADQCLSEPQVIDGRVVDLKPAVPGAPLGKSPTNGEHSAMGFRSAGSPVFPPGSWDTPSMFEAQVYATQAAMAAHANAAWAAAWAAQDYENLDCLDVLRKGSGVDAGDFSPTSSAVTTTASMSMMSTMSTTPPGKSVGFKSMSASAREFVPKKASFTSNDTPQKVALPAPMGVQRRSMFSDITNTELSPMKAPLPDALKGDEIASSLADLDSLRQRPSVLDMSEADTEAEVDGHESGSDSSKENHANDLASSPKNVQASPGLVFPPGLAPPPHLQHLAEDAAVPSFTQASILSTIPSPTSSMTAR
mmetsp:Transcript_144263/g.462035  ORF Transcript_144263/g.462035 Transcript_144263/m.462035 type:complete len:381 (-) Transcript_144263:387-1529(-)